MHIYMHNKISIIYKTNYSVYVLYVFCNKGIHSLHFIPCQYKDGGQLIKQLTAIVCKC